MMSLNITESSEFFEPIISFSILITLVIVMLIFYRWYRIVPLMLLTFFITLIICFISIQEQNIPFTPYIQTFIILINLVLTINTLFQYNYRKKR